MVIMNYVEWFGTLGVLFLDMFVTIVWVVVGGLTLPMAVPKKIEFGNAYINLFSMFVDRSVG
jgi:hypothetical protein